MVARKADTVKGLSIAEIKTLIDDLDAEADNQGRTRGIGVLCEKASDMLLRLAVLYLERPQ